MHSNLNILHVEDSVLDQKTIRHFLLNLGFSKIFQCRNIKEAESVMGKQDIDLAILDIMLVGSEIDGVSYAMEIVKKYDIPVLFTSSLSNDSTLERTCLLPDSEYIVKPVSERQLFVSLKKLLIKYLLSDDNTTGIRLSNSSYFLIKSNTKFYLRIEKSEVTYLEASKGGTIIHHTGGKHFVYITLHKVVEQLQKLMLIRCHASYAFSIVHLGQFSEEEVILNSGKVLPISRSYRKQVRANIQKLILSKT